MKIRLENATASQLRAFILATWGIDTAANATAKSLKNKLVALEFEDEEFEISEEEVDLATTDLKEGIWTPQHAVAALVAGGMSEEDARQLLNLAEKGKAAERVRQAHARGEKPYGPGKEHLYCNRQSSCRQREGGRMGRADDGQWEAQGHPARHRLADPVSVRRGARPHHPDRLRGSLHQRGVSPVGTSRGRCAGIRTISSPVPTSMTNTCVSRPSPRKSSRSFAARCLAPAQSPEALLAADMAAA